MAPVPGIASTAGMASQAGMASPGGMASQAGMASAGMASAAGMASTGGMAAVRGRGDPSSVRAGFGLGVPRSRGPASTGGSRRAGRSRAGGPRPGEEFPDEPGYGSVLALTAGWYLVPVVLYVVWLITVGTDRPGATGRDVASGIPWLLAALVLSLIVGGLLRWAIVGWRGLTLSFAAAVIGAGVATIAHSLSV
jgi:hypothetical protein